MNIENLKALYKTNPEKFEKTYTPDDNKHWILVKMDEVPVELGARGDNTAGWEVEG